MSIQRAQYDVSIYRGDTPTFKYQLIDVDDQTGEETPVDITDHTITAQVRYSPDSTEVWFTFPIVKVDAANGVFKWSMTKELSEEILPVGSFEPDTAVYDMQIERDGSVFTFMYGAFKVTRDITRA
ncbi:hypothetical protein [Vibrio sp. ER1A]|uniref:hypothetical protein n=1 Tax=Vibrio sp. ER1A TaxID=1517681 RepID=UPI0004DCE233|nr:hypothetical protein [Vibrio sp. ER1A]KFA97562.1 hypothetical protein HW45_09140 [Vibrio sp. ER1A]